MAKKNPRGLGRGLGALLGEPAEPEAFSAPVAAPTAAEPVQNVDRVVDLPLTSIDPNQDQARRRFDEKALTELSQSIGEVGVIQPIVVARNGDRYTIIAGERRFRASRMAGMETIPAIVRDWDEHRRMAASLVENLQRDDLNPIEEASGIQALMDRFGMTQDQVARQLGKSRPAVANATRLLTLPEEVRQMLIDGKLTAGHGRALVTVPGDERKIKLANLAVQQAWSVRRLEQVVALGEAAAEPKQTPPRQPELGSLESMAREVFGTRVKLEGGMDKGKLVLSYYSADDLQHIWDVIERMKPEA